MNGEREDHYHISHLRAHIINICQTKRVAFLRFSISLPCTKNPMEMGTPLLYTTKRPAAIIKI